MKKTITHDFLKDVIEKAKQENVSSKFIINLLEDKEVIVDADMKALLQKELG